MATTVGTEDTFEKLVQNLLILEHDAIAAYKSTIEKLEDENSKSAIAEFLDDRVVLRVGLLVKKDRHAVDSGADERLPLRRAKGPGNRVPLGPASREVDIEIAHGKNLVKRG